MSGLLDYFLCDQTVTRYRKNGNLIQRQVIKGCYYSWKTVQREDEMGIRRETLSLLILPGENADIKIGDRIYPGTGPQIGISDWGTFLPVSLEGLSEINYVMPYYWEGTVCHIEAGRK